MSALWVTVNEVRAREMEPIMACYVCRVIHIFPKLLRRGVQPDSRSRRLGMDWPSSCEPDVNFL
jgi:hypothetical protein